MLCDRATCRPVRSCRRASIAQSLRDRVQEKGHVQEIARSAGRIHDAGNLFDEFRRTGLWFRPAFKTRTVDGGHIVTIPMEFREMDKGFDIHQAFALRD